MNCMMLGSPVVVSRQLDTTDWLKQVPFGSVDVDCKQKYH